MALEIKIPSPGESISEVELTSWLVEDGAWVAKNQEIGEVESEKATLPLIATQAGQVKLLAKEGDTIEVGAVVASIDTSAPAPEGQSGEEEKEETGAEAGGTAAKEAATEVQSRTDQGSEAKDAQKKATAETSSKDAPGVKTTPLARKIMEEEGWSLDEVLQGLRKLGADDVRNAMTIGKEATTVSAGSFAAPTGVGGSRDVERRKMSQLRKKISQRLVSVRNETAMLTTFNEVDMSPVMELRKKYQQAFTETHGIKLGFMSFFTRAVCVALKEFPDVNSRIEEDEIVKPAYSDIGIAVQTEKGLMVPVIRNAETMSLADLEKAIADLAARARKARLTIEEMSGGTFSISNGGIYGSMLSTPILNPPQSGILGMHNIQERPVAINGKVEIRPMMYLALSYDHRIIDGKDSVGFLKRMKHLLENPADLIGGISPEQILLGLD